MQRKDDSLTQLILSGQRICKERSLNRIQRKIVADAVSLVVSWITRNAGGARCILVVKWERKIGKPARRKRELLVEISPETHGFHACNFRRSRSPAGLFKKANSVGIAGQTHKRIGSQGWIRNRRITNAGYGRGNGADVIGRTTTHMTDCHAHAIARHSVKTDSQQYVTNIPQVVRKTNN